MPAYDHKRRNRTGFFDLAGELRNKVYIYHYDTVRLVELMPTKANYNIIDAHALTLDEFQLRHKDEGVPVQGIRSGKLLGKFTFFEGMKTRWNVTISGLHVANRQVHQECLAMLYRSIAIFVQSPNRIRNFIQVVPKPNLQLIKRFHLDHQTYGSPEYRHNEIWKKKHHVTWMKTCKLVTKELPNIENLHINVDVLDRPLRFNFSESWVKLLFIFGCLKHLNDVEVNVFSSEVERTKINVKDGNIWGQYYPWYVRMLVEQHGAAAELHKLFGKAIAMKIQGFCDDCALEEYRDACQNKHRFWVHPSNMGEHEL
jgi:hypothetical protein